jgi:hypothetical protein
MEKKVLMIGTCKLVLWTNDSMVVVPVKMARNDSLKLMPTKMARKDSLAVRVSVSMT